MRDDDDDEDGDGEGSEEVVILCVCECWWGEWRRDEWMNECSGVLGCCFYGWFGCLRQKLGIRLLKKYKRGKLG